jgi:hypothetical protein
VTKRAGRGDAEAFVASGQPERWIAGRRSDERQFVWRGGAEAGPDAKHVERADGRHVEGCALEHGGEQRLIDGRVFIAILARRANEDLSRAPRLNVEGHRIGS